MNMPIEWTQKKLRQIGKCITGLTYSPSDVVEENGLLVLRSSNVQNGKLIFNDNVYVTHTVRAESLNCDGDILVCVRNGSRSLIGKSALILGAGAGVAHGAFMILFRTKDAAFVYQLFQSSLFYRQVHRNLGATINSINSSDFYDFEFPFPPDDERSKIAAMLSTWDTAIEKTERLIEAKEKRFSWLLAHVLHASEHGVKQWQHLRIGNIAGRVQRKSDGGDYPILTISSSSGFVLQKEKYSRFMAGKSVENYTLLRRGEFAYNKGNSLRYQFGCIFQLQNYKEALVPHVYVCFKLHDGVDSSFLSYIFQSDYLKEQLGAIVNSGVRNNGLLNIRPNDFMKVTVPLPPVVQQKKIADILDGGRKEIDLLKKQAEAYRKQKRGLMQKLLTGQWRVKYAEELL
jgi:type I restriction enzyme S subunit